MRLVDGQAEPAFKASGDITSMAHADGYIEIASDVAAVDAHAEAASSHAERAAANESDVGAAHSPAC